MLSPTSCPVQNIGHLSHGGPLALANQVLKYGFRTINGRTGGVNVEASAMEATAAIAAHSGRCILKLEKRELVRKEDKHQQ